LNFSQHNISMCYYVSITARFLTYLARYIINIIHNICVPERKLGASNNQTYVAGQAKPAGRRVIIWSSWLGKAAFKPNFIYLRGWKTWSACTRWTIQNIGFSDVVDGRKEARNRISQRVRTSLQKLWYIYHAE